MEFKADQKHFIECVNKSWEVLQGFFNKDSDFIKEDVKFKFNTNMPLDVPEWEPMQRGNRDQVILFQKNVFANTSTSEKATAYQFQGTLPHTKKKVQFKGKYLFFEKLIHLSHIELQEVTPTRANAAENELNLIKTATSNHDPTVDEYDPDLEEFKLSDEFHDLCLELFRIWEASNDLFHGKSIEFKNPNIHRYSNGNIKTVKEWREVQLENLTKLNQNWETTFTNITKPPIYELLYDTLQTLTIPPPGTFNIPNKSKLEAISAYIANVASYEASWCKYVKARPHFAVTNNIWEAVYMLTRIAEDIHHSSSRDAC